MRLSVAAICVAALVCGASAHEPAQAVARNPYFEGGVVVSTNDPAAPAEGTIEGSYTPAGAKEDEPCDEKDSTGATGAEAPIEDRIDALPEIQKRQDAYQEASKAVDADECGAECLIRQARDRELELARARTAAHAHISKIEHEDVQAAVALTEEG